MKKFILILSCFAIFSCKKEEKVIVKTNIKPDSANVILDSANVQNSGQIKLDVFAFPSEVQGCSCYFAKNKAEFDEEKYIYIDDYGNNAFLKINGETVKIPMEEGDFDPENFSKNIENGEYKVTISGEKLKNLKEVMMFEGTITVEDKLGNKTTSPIYGECGC